MNCINLASKVSESASCPECDHEVIYLSGKWMRLNTPVICDGCGIKLKVKDQKSTVNLVIMLLVALFDILIALSARSFDLVIPMLIVLLVALVLINAFGFSLLRKRGVEMVLYRV